MINSGGSECVLKGSDKDRLGMCAWLQAHLCSDTLGGFPVLAVKCSKLASTAPTGDRVEAPGDGDRMCR